MRIHLFYMLGYNPVLYYLFCCSSSSRFGHWELFQVGSCVPLTLHDVPGTCCIFPASVLAITPRNPVSLIAEWYFQTKIWALGVLIAPMVSISSELLFSA